MALSLGYSPCPNDTFIFYAMVHQKIDIDALRVKEVLLDVETLNQKALNSEFDITKVSPRAEHWDGVAAPCSLQKGT